ncbi:uracil-DNA glycosylase-like protein [Gloeopeniophorella convolvens]|nr:uracil-DNA glycosylase-like protein [Gloeopeniophorella convolvens]
MADPPKKRVVYLEDLEAPSSQASAASPDEEPGADANAASVVSNAAGSAKPKAAAAAPAKTTTGKRQRTLFDMMGPASASSGSTTKKPKLAAGTQATSASTSASASAPALQSLDSIPFSLSEYKAALTDDQRRLLRLECETMGKSWLKILKDELTKPYFLALKEFLWAEGVHGPDDSAPGLKIYPPPRDIYAWSNHTPLGRVRVVMIGQDPYHGPGQAHGLCFSVPAGVAVPPSLRNIYAEIKAEYADFVPPKHGNLIAWADAGVLMLNTSLTVRAGAAGSHQGRGWETFTERVLDAVDRYGGAGLGARAGVGRGVVFLAWGAWAAKRVARLSKSKHLILTSAHPSPLSARRGFLGNGHFKAANDWLEARYGPDGRVDWCRLAPVI